MMKREASPGCRRPTSRSRRSPPPSCAICARPADLLKLSGATGGPTRTGRSRWLRPLSDSSPPGCGIVTVSAARHQLRATPCPSWPKTQAQGRQCQPLVDRGRGMRWWCQRHRQRVQIGRRQRLDQMQREVRAMPARSTFGDHSAALPFIASTWRTPSAAALRRMVPTLPGSRSRSSTTVATPGSGCWPLEGRDQEADRRGRLQRADLRQQRRRSDDLGGLQRQLARPRLQPGRGTDHRQRCPSAPRQEGTRQMIALEPDLAEAPGRPARWSAGAAS